MRVFDVSFAAVLRAGDSRYGRSGPLLRRAGLAAVSWLAVLLLSTSPSMAAPTIGEAAPDFIGTDTQGTNHALADYRGSTIVLEWTNHKCPYTAKHYQARAMQTLQKEAKSNGIVWFSIISSAPGTQGHVTAAEADALTESRNAAPTAVILDADGTLARLYEAKTTPHMFVIDSSGLVVYMGAIDDQPSARGDPKSARNYVRLALNDLAAGRSVSFPATQPYGCSIKYAD